MYYTYSPNMLNEWKFRLPQPIVENFILEKLVCYLTEEIIVNKTNSRYCPLNGQCILILVNNRDNDCFHGKEWANLLLDQLQLNVWLDL